MSAGESDIVLVAFVFALCALLAGFGLPRAFRDLRRRSRRFLRHSRRRSAARYEDFYRLLEQANPLQEDEPNGDRARRRKTPTPRYRRADNGQYTTETYAKQHPTKTMKEPG